MGTSPTPPGLLERILLEVDKRVTTFARSGFLRNAVITEGGLTIKGGLLKMLSAVTGGVATFYVGPITPALPDGSYQPGFQIRRNDGSTALLLWDPRPDLDGFLQFLGWYDRGGRAIFTDDTVSGQGIGRPYLPGVAYPAQPRHWPSTAVASPTWEALYRVRHNKQNPRLYVQAWGYCDTAGTTGEIAVFADDVQIGSTQAVTSAAVQEFIFGPTAIDGVFGQSVTVELRARRTAGAGNVQTCFSLVEGRQS